MPFGLNNAPGTIQRLMELYLEDLNQECLLISLDDIIIFSAVFKEHLHRVEQVLVSYLGFMKDLRLLHPSMPHCKERFQET